MGPVPSATPSGSYAGARHLRANYGAKLSMIDHHWFGEVLSALDYGGLWDDTAVIVRTDHGHYLGDVRCGKFTRLGLT